MKLDESRQNYMKANKAECNQASKKLDETKKLTKLNKSKQKLKSKG